MVVPDGRTAAELYRDRLKVIKRYRAMNNRLIEALRGMLDAHSEKQLGADRDCDYCHEARSALADVAKGKW